MSPTYSRVMCCDLKRRFSPALWIWTLGSHRKTAIVGYPAHIKSCGFTVVTKQFVLHTIPGKMRGDAIVLSFSTERTAILTKGTFKISKETMKTKKRESPWKSWLTIQTLEHPLSQHWNMNHPSILFQTLKNTID